MKLTSSLRIMYSAGLPMRMFGSSVASALWWRMPSSCYSN